MGTWERPTLPARWGGASHPVFVGRRRELDTIGQAWAAARDGARQVVLLGGEPGAGKSRLAAEAATGLAQHGAAVLLGSCVAEFGPAHQPFVEPVAALASAVRSGRLRDGSPLGELLARLDTLVDETGSGGVGSGGAEDHRSEDRQHELHDASVRVVRAATAQCPLVLVLDDLHWAADSGLQLLLHLVEATPDARLLVLVTYRTAPADRSAPLVRTLARLIRLEGVQRVELTGLDVHDVADYLEVTSGESRARAEAVATLVRSRSGGNPFFLRELWRDLSARGGLSAVRAAGSLTPASVRDMVDGRLQQVSGCCRDTVQLAAVLGERFDGATLLRAGEAAVEDTLEALDQAVATSLLEPTPGTGEEFRFPHSLVRQAILELTTPSRRTRWHARAARALEAGPPAVELRVQRMAHHFASAATLGLADEAVRYLVEAAEIADRSRAHSESGRLLERAAVLATRSARRDELHLRAAHQALKGGDFARARDLAETVTAGGSAESRLDAALTYELASWRPGRPGHRAVELLTAALAATTQDPADPVHVRALACLGRAMAFTGAAGAGAVADRAITSARAIADDVVLSDALEPSLQHPLRPADLALRRARAQELTRLAARTGRVEHSCAAAYFRAVTAYATGAAGELAHAHEDLARAAARIGQPYWGYQESSVAYARHFLRAEFSAAERRCADSLTLSEAFGTDDASGPYGLQMYMLRREAGALGQVRGLITGNESLEEHWPPGLLALYTELGLREASGRVVQTLLEGELDSYRSSSVWPAVLVFLVEAALSSADAAAAARLRPMLSEYAGTNLSAGPFVAVFGAADRYLAGLARLCGDDPEPLFASALALDERSGSPVHRAYTLAALAADRRGRGAFGGAVDEPAGQARELAERYGLRRVLTSLRTAPRSGRAATGAQAPAPAHPTAPALASGSDGLTARELEVLRLLEEGLSNRDIAARLVVTENTAANHVRSILQKTGSANRTQAALYSLRRRTRE